MTLQNAETARQTAGTGINSLMIPAPIMGTEQAIVTRTVKMMLNRRVIAASNLDILCFFKWLSVLMPGKPAQGADFTRNRVKDWRFHTVTLMQPVSGRRFIYNFEMCEAYIHME